MSYICTWTKSSSLMLMSRAICGKAVTYYTLQERKYIKINKRNIYIYHYMLLLSLCKNDLCVRICMCYSYFIWIIILSKIVFFVCGWQLLMVLFMVYTLPNCMHVHCFRRVRKGMRMTVLIGFYCCFRKWFF